MLVASTQVIDHRTKLMAASGPGIYETDREEFYLMGQEKIEAASESFQAMSRQMMSINQQLSARAVGQLISGAADMAALLSSRTIGQGMARHAKLIRTMTRGANTVSQISTSTAQALQDGLKPIHSRATANAKRLGKK
jgi:hypothetical protein